MGVKDLWSILAPICERKPLFELQGQKIAIDLSCWVIDTQTATENAAQPKMYLRNLFFRTANLLLQDIWPVFVLEGKAPDIKQKTIDRRNEIQQLKHTGKIVDRKKAKKSGRTRFNHVLKQCEEMLGYMGLMCVHGCGEAEETCAYLNKDGLVDGCVSQDNDCFLYGAKVVYRNFNVSGSNASNGSIDVYRMEKIEEGLNLDRNKMIALALICGCDYHDGINGVGKESALRLFAAAPDQNILDRIKSWRTEARKYEKIEAEASNPKVCTSCGHQGNVRLHNKSGCLDCCTLKNCKSDFKETRKLIMNEIILRKKALEDTNFPSQEILDEYLVRKGPALFRLQLKWYQPKLVKFINFMDRHLGWDADYSFEKILPIITRWQLLNLPEIALRENVTFIKFSPNLPLTWLLYPDRIKKVRNIKSVACYEIIWHDGEGFMRDLIPWTENHGGKSDEEEENSNPNSKVTKEIATIEPQSLVCACYSELVRKFEDEQAAKKKPKGRKKVAAKPKEPAEVVQEKTKKPVKRGKKKNVEAGVRKIDDYLMKEPVSLEESFSSMTITPKRLKSAPQLRKVQMTEQASKMNSTIDRIFDSLTVEDFASDCEDPDMSIIIEKICNSKKVDDALSSDSNDVDNPNDDESITIEIPDPIDEDITEKFNASASNDCENEFTDVESRKEMSKHDISDEFDYIDNYVPLSQRVNVKHIEPLKL